MFLLVSSCGPEHAENTRPCLPDSRLDLAGWQGETIGAPVAKLVSVRVGCVSSDIGVVSRRTGGSVQSRAAGTDSVCGSRDGADGGCGVCGQCAVRSIVLGARAAVVAVRPANVLA